MAVSRPRTPAPAAEAPRYAALRDPGRRVPGLVGALTYLAGFANILSGLAATWRHRFDLLAELLPGTLDHAASAATLVSGILLLLLAHALRRRKHRAWRATVLLLAASVLLHAIRFEPALLITSLAALVLLVVYRKEFTALGDPATRWRALRVFVLLAMTSLVAGFAVVSLSGRHVVGGRPGFVLTVQEVATGLVGLNGPLVYRGDRFADLVSFTLLGLGLVTLLTTVYLALRSPDRRPELTAEEQCRLRLLLDRQPDSLGYFNLRDDKGVVWSDSGKSAIAYRVVSGVMLASGDPLGDPEAWPGAIVNYLAEARAHAWTPAVLGCSERAGTIWSRDAGFAAIELGDEAIVTCQSFSLEGRAMRNVRQMVKRIRRAGYATQVVRARDLGESERRRMLTDAAAWRGSATERGFSMALGRLADPADPDAVLVIARQDGVVRAFLQFVPWGSTGMSLDVMRRDRTADPGVNELLIVDALEAAPGLGVEQVSLNFAAFRSALERGERLGAGPVLRAWRSVLIFSSRWFQIESLYRFNAKFQPEWVPRFLIYPAGRDLPRVAMAALEAEAFLTWPHLRVFGAGPR